ncbi:hypothetical protein SAMN05443247_10506 [Bradyrhizobium erythrophlei]|jgi:hypothetical protein|nr:hypothetical protein SAMN05443247_10506 [Bradyrhizobium erythrophlei]
MILLMKYAAARPYADPEKAARKLPELANAVEPVQDGRIHIEKINAPFLFKEGGSPAEYGAGLALAITTNQEAIIRLFKIMNRYVGNLPPMPGVFPDYPAPVVRSVGDDRELAMMRWGMPSLARAGRRLPISATRHRRTGAAG